MSLIRPRRRYIAPDWPPSTSRSTGTCHHLIPTSTIRLPINRRQGLWLCGGFVLLLFKMSQETIDYHVTQGGGFRPVCIIDHIRRPPSLFLSFLLTAIRGCVCPHQNSRDLQPCITYLLKPPPVAAYLFCRSAPSTRDPMTHILVPPSHAPFASPGHHQLQRPYLRRDSGALRLKSQVFVGWPVLPAFQHG